MKELMLKLKQPKLNYTEVELIVNTIFRFNRYTFN